MVFTGPPASGDRRWRLTVGGVTAIAEAGYWKYDDADSASPPNMIADWDDDHWRYVGRGLLEIYPPGGEWPANVRRIGLRVTQGWSSDQAEAENIRRAVILMARELFDETVEIRDGHPVWHFIRSARPLMYTAPEVLNVA